jgi:cytochrome c553
MRTLGSSVYAAAMALLALTPVTAAAQPVTMLPQWSDQARNTFYTTSQGSHMIPLAWFKALKRLDKDEPFGADQLVRYGYIANNPPNADRLPIGFVVDRRPIVTQPQLGMTCAACHTNQLEYVKDGQTRIIRLDGAPTLADFQQFLTDLTAAAGATLNDDNRFRDFARAVLGQNAPSAKVTQLNNDFRAWVAQFRDFMDRSLPDPPWGPGRLDAFGMIFNRVTGKDLGIPDNFRKADAPVSYPFLWNASRQDKTQWNGGVPNGLFIHALGRNTGEVFGVFADFKPKVADIQIPFLPKLIDYTDNSADFAGLQTLEEQIVQLKPPKWPRDIFPVDDARAARGETLFRQHCDACHEKKDSPTLGKRGFDTPVVAVGSDEKMVRNSRRVVDPGLLIDSPLPPPAPLPPLGPGFEDQAAATDVLAATVVGSLVDAAFPKKFIPPSQLPQFLQSGVWRAIQKDFELSGGLLSVALNPGASSQIEAQVKNLLKDIFKPPARADAPAAYESRVLEGIWATAPYLHNGSVPNLWELLKKPQDRVKTFKVGSRKFDSKNVGYATDESPYASGTFTVDPANANGNGNGGHVYGTDLSEDDRWAIVEYLKTL